MFTTYLLIIYILQKNYNIGKNRVEFVLSLRNGTSRTGQHFIPKSFVTFKKFRPLFFQPRVAFRSGRKRSQLALQLASYSSPLTFFGEHRDPSLARLRNARHTRPFRYTLAYVRKSDTAQSLSQALRTNGSSENRACVHFVKCTAIFFFTCGLKNRK